MALPAADPWCLLSRLAALETLMRVRATARWALARLCQAGSLREPKERASLSASTLRLTAEGQGVRRAAAPHTESRLLIAQSHHTQTLADLSLYFLKSGLDDIYIYIYTRGFSKFDFLLHSGMALELKSFEKPQL